MKQVSKLLSIENFDDDTILIIWRELVRGKFIRTTKIYIREKVRLEHFVIKYKAWGIQKDIIRLLQELDCKWVILDYENKKGEKKIYRTKFNNFIKYGITDELNEEAGLQVFLHMDYWKDIIHLKEEKEKDKKEVLSWLGKSQENITEY